MNPRAATAFSDSELLNQECEKIARKREQNRIAQKTYRLNQKRRIQALERAMKQSSHAASLPEPATLGDSEMERVATAIHRRSNSTLSAESSDVSNSAVIFNISSEALLQPETRAVVPGLDPCQMSDVPELPELVESSSSSRTPLHIAIKNKNPSLVRLLLQNGADAARQDNDGSTALHLAVESGQEETVSALLKRGVDPNKPDYSGRTALFRAIEAGEHAVARLLLDSASDLNIKDMWGNTALHLAVEANSETLTLLLLEYGAHVDP